MTSNLCRHLPACSGCSVIDVPYAEQLDRKLRAVRDLFAEAELGGFKAESICKITPSPSPLGYRNRAKLVPAYEPDPTGRRESDSASPPAARGSDVSLDKRIRLGLYREGTHDVVDTAGCAVQTDRINRTLDVVRSAIEQSGIPLYDEVVHTGELRFVTVREGLRTREILIGLVTRTDNRRHVDELAGQVMRQCESAVGVVQNVNPTKGNVIFGPTNHTLAGRDWFEEDVCETRVRLGLTSFFQVNTAVAEKAYEAIIEALDLREEDTLLDLYCGVGAIGLIAARAAGQVVGIEQNPEATTLAQTMRRENKLDNVNFMTGLVEQELPMLVGKLRCEGAGARRLVAAVNPPRKGVDARVIEALIEHRPDRIAYLSCAPLTLLRDLARLVEGGFRLRHVELFDMFPQTSQVETLAILTDATRDDDQPLRRGRRASRRTM